MEALTILGISSLFMEALLQSLLKQIMMRCFAFKLMKITSQLTN